MTECRLKHFNRVLPGEFSIPDLNKQARACAKAWGVPLKSVTVDATYTYDDSPILELSASRMETPEEAKARAAKEVSLRVTYSGTPCPPFDVDPVAHMLWREYNRNVG